MTRLPCVAAVLAAVALAAPAASQPNCSQTSVGLTPISELGPGLYLGQFTGGLYPGGQNAMPPAHAAEGLARAAAIQPLNIDGQPDPAGKYVLLSIGMSNATQEFCGGTASSNCQLFSFMGQAAASPYVNRDELVIIDGALGGQTAPLWASPTSQNYVRVAELLAARGLSEAQVQAIWVKQASAGPTVSLPAENADAWVLMQHLGNLVRAARVRYPNLKIVFFSSRTYGGYAGTQLNPEPYAYETGFAFKWLIESQISQMSGGAGHPRAGNLDYTTVAPWLAWGPYLWADGLTPRADGLTYRCQDFANDGVHPAQGGRTKVGTQLLEFMLNSPFATPWFRDDPACPADWDRSGAVDSADISAFITTWLRDVQFRMRIADFDGNGVSNSSDISAFITAWVADVSLGCR